MQSRTKPALNRLPVASVRASVSFPENIYKALEEVARRKKVSLAWVVRDAAEKYLAGELSVNEEC